MIFSKDIIPRVRDLLSDTADVTGEYRWGDPDLLQWGNEGLKDMFRRRPDAFYLDDGEIITDPPDSLDRVEKGVPIREEFAPALIDYILYRCYLRDGEDPENQSLAGTYYAAYQNGIA